MVTARVLRPIRAGAVSVVLLLIASGCAAPAASESDDDSAGERFWAVLRIEGDEVEGFGSIADMAASSDAVVRGEFDSVGLSRTIQGDAAEDTVAYVAVTLRIIDTLRGSVPSDEVPLEFLVPGTARDADAALSEMTETMPEGEVVLFLREKRGPGETGLYRLVSSRGLWINTDGKLDAPLSDDAESLYAPELSAVETVEALAAVLEQP